MIEEFIIIIHRNLTPDNKVKAADNRSVINFYVRSLCFVFVIVCFSVAVTNLRFRSCPSLGPCREAELGDNLAGG